jgi:glycolate dehydrogenase FAD-binding subunit
MSCEIDGKQFPDVRPETVGDACQIVRDAAGRGQAIYPVGGRTMLDLGLPPERDGIALDTTRLDRVVDYPSRDMTITVEAGIRVSKLQQLLSTERQRLPVDVPRLDEATLGGTIATNISGPRRYGFGTLRDYIIGITVVDSAGRETKAGGRVVKNVAGYDLCKLYTGSLGTLGVITQLTLKLRPLCESTAIGWLATDQDSAASQALDRLANSRTRPVAIELLNSAAANRVVTSCAHEKPLGVSQWVLIVGFEENAQAVRWQQQQIVAELSGLDLNPVWIEGEEAGSVWDSLTEFQSAGSDPVTIKANIRSSAIFEWFKVVRAQKLQWAMQAHAGNGIAYGHLTSHGDVAAVEHTLASLRSFALEQRGNLVIRRCPTAWKRAIALWGAPRKDLWLMQAVKLKLDPDGTFNPGRFLV